VIRAAREILSFAVNRLGHVDFVVMPSGRWYTRLKYRPDCIAH
jgi:hypothetical protein